MEEAEIFCYSLLFAHNMCAITYVADPKNKDIKALFNEHLDATINQMLRIKT